MEIGNFRQKYKIVGWVTTNGKISSMDLTFTAGSNMVSSEKEKWDEA